jgi:hypothetical protein
LTIHYVTEIEEVVALALLPSSAQTHTPTLPVSEPVRHTVN